MHRRNGQRGRPGTQRLWRETSWGDREKMGVSGTRRLLRWRGYVLARDMLPGAAFVLLLF